MLDPRKVHMAPQAKTDHLSGEFPGGAALPGERQSRRSMSTIMSARGFRSPDQDERPVAKATTHPSETMSTDGSRQSSYRPFASVLVHRSGTRPSNTLLGTRRLRLRWAVGLRRSSHRPRRRWLESLGSSCGSSGRRRLDVASTASAPIVRAAAHGCNLPGV